MYVILPIIYAFLFIYLILKLKYFEIEKLGRVTLILLFSIKLLVGFIACWMYSNYYSSSDFYTFFNDGQLLFHHLMGIDSTISLTNWDSNFDPVIFNSSRTMIFLNAIMGVFSFSNFYVHVVFFCFFSFLGLIGIFKAFNNHFQGRTKRLIFSIFLVPSVLFWSSTALKETVVIGILGLIIYHSDFGLARNLKTRIKILLFLLIVFLVLVKMYVAFALIPVLILNQIITKTSRKLYLIKFLFVFVSISLVAFVIAMANPDYNVLQLISNKQANAISEAKGGLFLVNDKNFICVDYHQQDDVLIATKLGKYKIRSGRKYLSWKLDNMSDTTFVENSKDSAEYKILYAQTPANFVIEMKRLKPELKAFLLYAPIAVFNVITRPFIFECKSFLQIGIAIENLWILILIVMVVISYNKEINNKKEILLFALIFSCTLFVLIGFTTPAMGAMIRYRTVGLVVLIPVFLLMIDAEKLSKRLGIKYKNKD